MPENSTQRADARALKITDLVAALKAAGSRTITEETVAADIADGAPSNPDGTVDMLKYAAWILMKENGHGD